MKSSLRRLDSARKPAKENSLQWTLGLDRHQKVLTASDNLFSGEVSSR
jgi:hypothetical protein